MLEKIKDKASELVENIKEGAENLADAVMEKAADLKDSIVDGARRSRLRLPVPRSFDPLPLHSGLHHFCPA